MNEAQASGVKTRAGPVLSLESRTAIWLVRFAISTQLLPEPPLYDDLNQAFSGASSGAVM